MLKFKLKTEKVDNYNSRMILSFHFQVISMYSKNL